MSVLSTIPADVDAIITANRTRAVGAGIDPNQYDQVTAQLTALNAWAPAFRATAAAHRRRADAAAGATRRVSAGEAYLAAALWAHFATCYPNPDRAAHRGAVAEAAAAYRLALTQLDPAAAWLDRRDTPYPFVGVLRRPVGVAHPPLALIIGGLDSGKEEFHYVAEALLARGVATFAFDGPGQAELSAATTIEPAYQRVVTHVLDTLRSAEADLGIDDRRVGAVALSLGGYYGVASAASDARLGALVTVSGLCALHWASLPALVTTTLAQRAGSEDTARAFAGAVDATARAADLTCPLLVVAGGRDIIPTPAEAERLAHTAPHGELLLVPEGDHLLANVQWMWLGQAAGWLAEHIDSARLERYIMKDQQG